MPNWVFNHVFIEGVPEQIQKVKDQLNKPFIENYSKGQEIYSNPIFSFRNIIAPPEDKLDEYFGTHGFKDGGEQGNTPLNWYNFNNREWGTKWDVAVPDVVKYHETELQEESDTSLHYKFDTAWSPPIPVIKKLSEQYPELTITISYEEESEWGGEIEYLAGEEISVSEYDTPNSHKDYVDREMEDNCVCSREEDKNEWYDDCPDKKEKPIELYATQDLVLTKEK